MATIVHNPLSPDFWTTNRGATQKTTIGSVPPTAFNPGEPIYVSTVDITSVPTTGGGGGGGGGDGTFAHPIGG